MAGKALVFMLMEKMNGSHREVNESYSIQIPLHVKRHWQ